MPDEQSLKKIRPVNILSSMQDKIQKNNRTRAKKMYNLDNNIDMFAETLNKGSGEIQFANEVKSAESKDRNSQKKNGVSSVTFTNTAVFTKAEHITEQTENDQNLDDTGTFTQPPEIRTSSQEKQRRPATQQTTRVKRPDLQNQKKPTAIQPHQLKNRRKLVTSAVAGKRVDNDLTYKMKIQ